MCVDDYTTVRYTCAEMNVPHELIELAHFLADGSDAPCILSEGNVSCRCDAGSFWVKASGHKMGEIDAAGFVRVNRMPLLAAISGGELDEAETRRVLNESVAGATDARPSTEAYVHCALLELSGVEFVAHSHPSSVISLLITEHGRRIASQRFFPDEIVLCGRASCFVPYTAPGLPLARAIIARTQEFVSQYGSAPNVWLLENHGIITTGRSVMEAQASTQMAIKSARIILGALATGSELNPLSREEVNQIANWTDEHYRQSLLWGSK